MKRAGNVVPHTHTEEIRNTVPAFYFDKKKRKASALGLAGSHEKARSYPNKSLALYMQNCNGKVEGKRKFHSSYFDLNLVTKRTAETC
jgi:type IV secretory pathway VirB4 component